jgi:excisionase family DNA binding protein
MERLLTVEQAAEMLNTKVRFVRRLIAERRIAYTKFGDGKGSPVRIPESAVLAFIAAGTVEPLRVQWCAGKVVA